MKIFDNSRKQIGRLDVSMSNDKTVPAAAGRDSYAD
jgi:hypothetical protein